MASTNVVILLNTSSPSDEGVADVADVVVTFCCSPDDETMSASSLSSPDDLMIWLICFSFCFNCLFSSKSSF